MHFNFGDNKEEPGEELGELESGRGRKHPDCLGEEGRRHRGGVQLHNFFATSNITTTNDYNNNNVDLRDVCFIQN